MLHACNRALGWNVRVNREEHPGGTHLYLHLESRHGPLDLLEHQVLCGRQYNILEHHTTGTVVIVLIESLSWRDQIDRCFWNSSEAIEPLGLITQLLVWDFWSSASLSF